MHRQDFHFELPERLIAKLPPEVRGDSRLLVLDGKNGALEDRRFSDLEELLAPGDLLVFNNTRVIPARIFGHKASGGKVEVLIERLVTEHSVLAQVKASKSPRTGSRLMLDGNTSVEVVARHRDLFELRFLSQTPVLELLETIGHMPLPPYIDRADTAADRERYQTVYNQVPGAVAAPTAGLHFTDEQLRRLTAMGVAQAFVTLHVGAGTFQPLRCERITDHQMHAEVMELSEEICAQVAATHARGGRVIAVGTTSVRCLETAAGSGTLRPYRGETDIFIYPGYEFKVVDVLITNFHLPESTLLMLVCAFAGFEYTLTAYRHAVSEAYRFFSYGDAMLIHRNPAAPAECPRP